MSVQNGSLQSSFFTSVENDRSRPLNPTSVGTTSLNAKLQTEHLDIPDDDTSLLANITRTISKLVGAMLSPRQVLGLLRVLKAITLSFLVLTILSDLMYIIFVELLADDKIQALAGGHRDTIIRLYGLGMAFLGLAIELDYRKVVRKFSGLKGFIPRSLVYFFIMQITGSHPIMLKYKHKKDNNIQYDDDSFDLQDIQIPSSAIGFQRVTSFVLGLCAIGYLVCGLLCFDRFTARAFLSNDDPRVTTAIPTPGGNNRTTDHLGNLQCDGSVTTAQQSCATDPVDRIQAW